MISGAVLVIGLIGCGPPPAVVPPPFEAPAAAAAAQANARQPQVAVVVDDTAEHLQSLASALASEGAAVVLSIMEAGGTPTTAPSTTVSGTSIVDGEVRVSESTITTSGVTPSLPDTGWGGAVARQAQERLLGAGLTVIDGAYASGDSDDDLLMEFKRVPGETSDEALQLRIIRRDDGRILTLVTAPVRGDADAWDRATDTVLKSATRDMLGQ